MGTCGGSYIQFIEVSLCCFKLVKMARECKMPGKPLDIDSRDVQDGEFEIVKFI